MSEYGGINMEMGKGKGKAMAEDTHQGGNKAAERGGANKGDVDHHMVDRIDHAGTASRAKSAMAEHGMGNCTYFDGGKK